MADLCRLRPRYRKGERFVILFHHVVNTERGSRIQHPRNFTVKRRASNAVSRECRSTLLSQSLIVNYSGLRDPWGPSRAPGLCVAATWEIISPSIAGKSYRFTNPPSTWISSPTMYVESSLARNTAALATSFTVPIRLSGTIWIKPSLAPGI